MSSWRSCVNGDCLGDKIFGNDVDELLAYQTPKVVKIRDRLLGLLKNLFLILIFIYVVIFQLLYKGSHFQMDTVRGIARIQLQHPTQRCNPMDVTCSSNYTSFANLPYCTQYTGNRPAWVQKNCSIFDANDLITPMDGGYLIPSFVQAYRQMPGCDPTKGNNYKCDKKYVFVDENGTIQKGKGRAVPFRESFIADFESFTILIDHSFRASKGTVEYDDKKMQGYWLDCSRKQWTINSTWLASESECEKKPIVCMHSECEELGMIAAKPHRKKPSLLGVAHTARENSRRRFRRNQQPASDLQTDESPDVDEIYETTSDGGLYSISAGDVMSMATLYSMAGRGLDEVFHDHHHGQDNATARERGTVLIVNIHYNNMQHWSLFKTKDPPEYVISAVSQPVDKYKRTKAISAPVLKFRDLQTSYGTLVVVQSTGTIGVFSGIHMLIVFSTSLGLLAVSGVITELLALNVLPMREEYNRVKFEETEDFHDIRASKSSNGNEGEASPKEGEA